MSTTLTIILSIIFGLACGLATPVIYNRKKIWVWCINFIHKIDMAKHCFKSNQFVIITLGKPVPDKDKPNHFHLETTCHRYNLQGPVLLGALEEVHRNCLAAIQNGGDALDNLLAGTGITPEKPQ